MNPSLHEGEDDEREQQLNSGIRVWTLDRRGTVHTAAHPNLGTCDPAVPGAGRAVRRDEGARGRQWCRGCGLARSRDGWPIRHGDWRGEQPGAPGNSARAQAAGLTQVSFIESDLTAL